MSTPAATARRGYLARRVNVLFQDAALPHAPKVIMIGDELSHVGPGPTVRLSLTDGRARRQGRYSSSEMAIDLSAFVTADVFWPSGEEGQPASIYAIDDCADQIEHMLRAFEYQINDYSDPDSVTAVSDAYYRNLTSPETRTLAPSDGYSRRQVVVEVQWYAAHSDAA